jgi:hypothetical protein
MGLTPGITSTGRAVPGYQRYVLYHTQVEAMLVRRGSRGSRETRGGVAEANKKP